MRLAGPNTGLRTGIRGTRFLAIGEPKAKTELRTAGRGPDSESVPVEGLY